MAISLTDPPLDVVAVGAHPDDVEMGCGGMLASLVRQGYRVGIIDLTDGEPTPGCPSPEVRLAEAVAAAKTLGVEHRKTLSLPNRRLFDTFESRIELARVLRLWRPRIVVGFGDKTPLASPDHDQAVQITDAAVFYSRLTRWEEHFEDLPPHQISAQLYFKLDYDTGIYSPTMTHFVVDISETLEQKMSSLLCYRSQFPPAKERFLHRCRSAALHVGALAGYHAGEMFVLTRTLGTGDPVKLLFAP